MESQNESSSFEEIDDAADHSISHSEFVLGVRDGSIGFKCHGEPCQLLGGGRKIAFNVLVSLYSIAPLILVTLWAYHEQRWWFLVGIVISWVASFLAACELRKTFLFFALFCVGYWIKVGFNIHEGATFLFLCALWRHIVFTMAEIGQNQFAMESLLENPVFFDYAVARNRITIVRRDRVNN